MEIRDVFLSKAQYNYWANESLIEVCKSLDESEIIKNRGNSFPSILETLYHIWDAELLWLKRLQGVSLDYWPSKEHKGELWSFLELWQGVSGGYIELIKNNSDEFISGDVSYKTTSGKEFLMPAWQMLMQVLNHSTYHRGQIITMIRQSGYDRRIKPLDYSYFIREQSKL